MLKFTNNNNNTFTATVTILETPFSYDYYVDSDNVVRVINSQKNSNTNVSLISYMDKLRASHTLTPMLKELGVQLIKFIKAETGNNAITKLA